MRATQQQVIRTTGSMHRQHGGHSSAWHMGQPEQLPLLAVAQPFSKGGQPAARLTQHCLFAVAAQWPCGVLLSLVLGQAA